jgi:hypothetical protein
MPPRRLGAWLRDWGAQAFGIDLRALAAFRIALGLTLLGFVASLSLDFELLFTGEGVLPARAVWPAAGTPLLEPSAVHAVVDSPIFVLSLLAAMAAAAVFLAAGRYSRSAAFCLWLGMSFLVRRNPFVSNASHSMILFCLLWSLFLPLGAVGSLDRLRGRAPRDLPQRLVSPATAGLVVQILFVYVTAALAKGGPEWHAEATALFIVAHEERYQTPFTPLLAALPAPALAALTHAVWHLEALAPLLLVSPVFFPPVRIAATLLLMALHLGLGVFMRLGIFPWICLTYLLVLLPGAFWDRRVPGAAAAGAVAAPGRVSPGPRAARALAALLLALTLVSYVRLAPGLAGNAPAWMRQLAGELRIGQVFRLFSRLGPSTNRYLVLGRLADGSLVELPALAPASPTWEAARISVAPDGSGRFPWVQYSGLVSNPDFALKSQAPWFAAYYCRVLAASAPLESVEIYHFSQRTDLASRATGQRLAYARRCAEPLP